MQNPSWPPFLDLLDSDRKAAIVEFYRFLIWTLNKVPPRPMRGLCMEDQEDVKHEILIHCIEKGFKVLRQYVPSAKPFAAWLYTVAHNVCVDCIRRKSLRSEEVSIHEDSNGKKLEHVLANPIDEERRHQMAHYKSIVMKVLEKMDDYCRILLGMAADEFTPREMALVLGLPPSKSKKVSDDLRYCREKLRKRLKQNGVDTGSIHRF